MDQNKDSQTEEKSALKQLRETRREYIEATSARMKLQQKAIKAVKEQLSEEPRTVPEIAELTGLSPDQVLWYVAALKKYGQVKEGDKDGGYFKYELAAEGS
jgi:predicted Rossmann fold nucleotide-binding protein DprA/Smf involved in DNA uptake